MFEKLSDQEKVDFAKEQRSYAFNMLQYSEQQMNFQADEFTKLEVQISAILFAFATVFVKDFAHSGSLTLKILFIVSISALVVSFILGLVVINRRGAFWKLWLEIRANRVTKWDSAIKKQIQVEEAQAYHDGTNAGKTLIAVVPHWAWILQTITLGIAVFSLILMFFLITFNH